MRIVLLVSLAALTPVVWGVNLKPLPSTATYQSQLDLDSVATYGSFALHRAFVNPQRHSSGKEYSSAIAQYFADCNAGKAALAMTEYYGEDRARAFNTNINVRWKSQFAVPEPGGDVAAAMAQACERFAAYGNLGEAGNAKKAEPAKPPARGASTGSGIVVDRDGLVLTNEHVVRQCDAFQVIREGNRILKATLRVADAARDLALLAVEERFPVAASVRADATPKQGEAVTVVGYPLVNVLSAQPNVGFGHVNSTLGVRGNTAQMQIDVSIQRGNSGGPVLDEAGNVIGVVVAKLDALKLAQRTGDLAQNINFAIRGDVVRSFLESNNVKFTTSTGSAKLENTEIASRGSAVTVLVRCVREPAPAARAQP